MPTVEAIRDVFQFFERCQLAEHAGGLITRDLKKLLVSLFGSDVDEETLVALSSHLTGSRAPDDTIHLREVVQGLERWFEGRGLDCTRTGATQEDCPVHIPSLPAKPKMHTQPQISSSAVNGEGDGLVWELETSSTTPGAAGAGSRDSGATRSAVSLLLGSLGRAWQGQDTGKSHGQTDAAQDVAGCLSTSDSYLEQYRSQRQSISGPGDPTTPAPRPARSWTGWEQPPVDRLALEKPAGRPADGGRGAGEALPGEPHGLPTADARAFEAVLEQAFSARHSSLVKEVRSLRERVHLEAEENRSLLMLLEEERRNAARQAASAAKAVQRRNELEQRFNARGEVMQSLNESFKSVHDQYRASLGEIECCRHDVKAASAALGPMAGLGPSIGSLAQGIADLEQQVATIPGRLKKGEQDTADAIVQVELGRPIPGEFGQRQHCSGRSSAAAKAAAAKCQRQMEVVSRQSQHVREGIHDLCLVMEACSQFAR
uniref:Uncharacterized protein n=1 Tax=Tetraselmis sp. GSL018 TaxID=582737 RepID=A0A061QYN0_9CHLO